MEEIIVTRKLVFKSDDLDHLCMALFVCPGNICCSPSAEAVMNGKLKTTGWERSVLCDSAGIIGFHACEQADARMRKHALRRGYKLTSLSRTVQPAADFDGLIIHLKSEDRSAL